MFLIYKHYINKNHFIFTQATYNWPLPGSQKWILQHLLYRGKICVHRHWWRIKAVADSCRGAVTGTSCLGRVDCWLEGGQATGERVSCCNQGVLVCNHCIQIGVDFVQSFKTNCYISVSIFWLLKLSRKKSTPPWDKHVHVSRWTCLQ